MDPSVRWYFSKGDGAGGIVWADLCQLPEDFVPNDASWFLFGFTDFTSSRKIGRRIKRAASKLELAMWELAE